MTPRSIVLAMYLVCGCASAQVAQCLPRSADGKHAALMTGAIRVGPADDRIELAGGVVARRPDGYDILYRFPGRETKWLMCAYGANGDIQTFEAMRREATECRLEVRNEAGPGAGVRMTCR